MKKYIWKILGVLLCAGMLFLAACGRQEQPDGVRMEVFFLNREETRITPEIRYLEDGLTAEEQVESLLAALQEQPEDMTLKPSVGAAFAVKSFGIEEKQLNLDLNEAYRSLPATTEVLVRAALVRTLSQVEGIGHVLMLVEGAPLADSTGAAIGSMTADLFVDNLGEEINAYENVTLRLYFANETGDRLVETSREVVYNSNISMEKLIVENLIAGPDGEGAYRTLNPAVRLLNVTVKDGTCYVIFDETFLTQTEAVAADVTIYSLVNSLVELANVNRVQIAVDGKTDLIYRETFSLANLYERNLDLTRTEVVQE